MQLIVINLLTVSMFCTCYISVPCGMWSVAIRHGNMMQSWLGKLFSQMGSKKNRGTCKK